MIPGEIRTGPGVVHVNSDRRKLRLTVVNDGDRPIQIGSHFHFFDVNPALSFDRSQAEGFRLDIPSGTSLRFEPGVGAEITLVELGGRGTVPGIVVRTAPWFRGAEGTAAGAAQDAAETEGV
ncbi:urease subunit beta [Streptomyces sp. NBC_01260]|uniref:urease subunit beta n=1 Tax=unclassified Streptomyces TaxID=2593676 RepID=UPI000F4711F3|nr:MULTISPECIES: urease subunit beta [unclassified Streptomyces]MCX4768894.1 urease subunit beta [Streptomyces sp. NBC_01285]ROQ76946.1 urease subunit beta [Streptomyces sp. CEV 2-1]RPK40845.1 Urease subunit beta [Streptomyces sp. ADI92-24]